MVEIGGESGRLGLCAPERICYAAPCLGRNGKVPSRDGTLSISNAPTRVRVGGTWGAGGVAAGGRAVLRAGGALYRTQRPALLHAWLCGVGGGRLGHLGTFLSLASPARQPPPSDRPARSSARPCACATAPGSPARGDAAYSGVWRLA